MQLERPSSVVAGFDPDAMFRRILVPIDFNDAARCAVAEALGLRRHFGSSVHLFCLAEVDEVSRFLAGTGAGMEPSQSLIVDAEARLKRFVDNVFPAYSSDIEVHAGPGMDVAEGLANEAKRIGATLVIVGDNPEKHLFRTQVELALQRVSCPVLIVRGCELH